MTMIILNIFCIITITYFMWHWGAHLKGLLNLRNASLLKYILIYNYLQIIS